MALQLPRHRFTVDDYHQMAQAGILGEDDRVELLDGEIVEMAPIGSGHAGSVGRLNELFLAHLRGRAQVWPQNPIRLDPHNEPLPDLALLRPRADFYTSALPAPADVLLVVEVADTSLSTDQRIKLPLYARSGILEAWLLDLQHDRLFVAREPTPTGYRVLQTLARGEQVAPVAFPTL